MLIESMLGRPLSDLLEEMQRVILADTTYCGVPTWKLPLDAWIYQEIVCETRPDAIVEIGNKYGGTLLYLAHLCDALDHGRLIGVDLTHRDVPAIVRGHPRITLLDGDGCARYPDVRALIGEGERVLVIEDSAHSYENTLAVLRRYQGLQGRGDYLIVEDTIVENGLRRQWVDQLGGPLGAALAFLDENPAYRVDRTRERFVVTWNPRGYLRRVAP
jgi:cephalosporin hydroxylase